MATAEPLVASSESVFDIGDRLTGLLKEARQESIGGAIPGNVLARLADVVETLRSRVAHKADRDPRSLFDLDERLVELLECADEAAQVGEIPQELLLEINDYLEAFQRKVDRIAGYWRWQESISAICAEEAERLSARKRAAERRLTRLKEMLLAFMTPRGAKRLEGEKPQSIAGQGHGFACHRRSFAIPVFLRKTLRFTKTELQEIVYQLADGQLRGRLEAALAATGWEIDGSAVRFAITNGSNVAGARLVKGHHVRLR
jgi:hypothetical protein